SFSVPASVRQKLPPEVVQELEARWSGLGDYTVIAEAPQNSRGFGAIQRFVRFGGRTLPAYVYGRRLNETTKFGVPLHGIEVGGVFALAQSCLRELENDEVPTGQVVDAQSRIATPSSGAQIMAQEGGKIYRFGSR